MCVIIAATRMLFTTHTGFIVLRANVGPLCYFETTIRNYSIISFMQIDSSWSQGNREMAFKQSRNAKRWGIGGIIGGLIAHSLTVVILGASIGLAFA